MTEYLVTRNTIVLIDGKEGRFIEGQTISLNKRYATKLNRLAEEPFLKVIEDK